MNSMDYQISGQLLILEKGKTVKTKLVKLNKTTLQNLRLALRSRIHKSVT